MLPYFALLALPSALALARVSRTSVLAGIVVVAAYTMFGGLRFEVGMDWFNYENLHFAVEGRSISDIFSEPEPLSMLLFKFSQESGADMTITNCFAAAILILGVVAYARRTLNPWLGVLAATPYLIIGFGMSGVRQAIGIGFTLLALSLWHRGRTFTQFGLIGLAALFHTSALVVALFLLLDLRLKRSTTILVMIPALALNALLLPQLDAGEETVSLYRYVDGSTAESLGSLFHIAFILLPGLAAVALRRKIFKYIEHPDLIWYGIAATLGLVLLNLLASTAASRLSLYLYFVPIAVYPAIVAALRGARMPATIAIVAGHFAILFLWFSFANNAYRHLPYQSLLFY